MPNATSGRNDSGGKNGNRWIGDRPFSVARRALFSLPTLPRFVIVARAVALNGSV
jgi:hypothetical protein